MTVAIPYDVIVLVLVIAFPARYIDTSTSSAKVTLPVPLFTMLITVPVGNATLALLGTVNVVGAVLVE